MFLICFLHCTSGFTCDYTRFLPLKSNCGKNCCDSSKTATFHSIWESDKQTSPSCSETLLGVFCLVTQEKTKPSCSGKKGSRTTNIIHKHLVKIKQWSSFLSEGFFVFNKKHMEGEVHHLLEHPGNRWVWWRQQYKWLTPQWLEDENTADGPLAYSSSKWLGKYGKVLICCPKFVSCWARVWVKIPFTYLRVSVRGQIWKVVS